MHCPGNGGRTSHLSREPAISERKKPEIRWIKCHVQMVHESRHLRSGGPRRRSDAGMAGCSAGRALDQLTSILRRAASKHPRLPVGQSETGKVPNGSITAYATPAGSPEFPNSQPFFCNDWLLNSGRPIRGDLRRRRCGVCRARSAKARPPGGPSQATLASCPSDRRPDRKERNHHVPAAEI